MAEKQPTRKQLAARRRFAQLTRLAARLGEGKTAAQRAAIRKRVFAKAKANPGARITAADFERLGPVAKQKLSPYFKSGSTAKPRARKAASKKATAKKRGSYAYQGATPKRKKKAAPKRKSIVSRLLGKKKTYSFKGKSRGGRKVSGTVSARSKAGAKRKVSRAMRMLNPSGRPVMRNGKKLYGAAAAAVLKSRKKATRKKTLANQKRAHSPIRKKSSKKAAWAKRATRRRNQSPAQLAAISETFLGRPMNGRVANKYAPASAPKDLADLGRLVEIRTTKEQFNFSPSDGYRLAANGTGKLWIVASKDERIEASTDLGEIVQLTYSARKTHHDNKMFDHYHDFNSPRPHLRTDSDGKLLITGGAYKVLSEGITG